MQTLFTSLMLAIATSLLVVIPPTPAASSGSPSDASCYVTLKYAVNNMVAKNPNYRMTMGDLMYIEQKFKDCAETSGVSEVTKRGALFETIHLEWLQCVLITNWYDVWQNTLTRDVKYEVHSSLLGRYMRIRLNLWELRALAIQFHDTDLLRYANEQEGNMTAWGKLYNLELPGQKA